MFLTVGPCIPDSLPVDSNIQRHATLWTAMWGSLESSNEGLEHHNRSWVYVLTLTPPPFIRCSHRLWLGTCFAVQYGAQVACWGKTEKPSTLAFWHSSRKFSSYLPNRFGTWRVLSGWTWKGYFLLHPVSSGVHSSSPCELPCFPDSGVYAAVPTALLRSA